VHRKTPIRCFLLVLKAIIVLVAVTGLFAQEYRGTLLGSVLDMSGSRVPDARVTATNTATNVRSTTQTNANGDYTLPYLQPGEYELRVEAKSFKSYQRGPIELRIDASLRVDVQLEIGTVTETVVVTAPVPLLDTASASAGQVVDKVGIEELPFAKGVPYHLIDMSPGVTLRTGAIEENPYDFSISNFAVAGSTDSSAVSIDGVITGGIMGAGSFPPSFSPPQESVEEFRVQTTTFDATQGFTTASNLNLSIKSGTNAPHGALYYQFTRPWLAANEYFEMVHGIPKADAAPWYWRLGGAVGGPVFIPKVYNGKNRTFFFASGERLRLHQIYGRTYTVPTPGERTGDFSALLSVGSQYQIYDPATRVTAPGGRYLENPFPGNILPASRISPIASSLLKFWPAQDAITPTGVNNYPSPSDGKLEWYWAGVVRIDHNVSDRQRIFFSFHHYHRNNQDAPCFQAAQNSAGCGLSWVVNPIGGAFDDVYTFSPSFIMDFRVGFERYPRIVDFLPWNQAGSWSYASIGMPAVLDSYTPVDIRRMPAFSPAGYTGIPNYSGLTWYSSDIPSVSLNFTKTFGSHTFRFGWEGRQYEEYINAPGVATTGSFTFGTTYTQGPNDNSPASPIGQGLAQMLLGQPTAGEIDRNPSSADKSQSWGAYFQEDWRVTPHLTLNLGLRYEYQGPTVERYNRSVTGFNSQAPLPIAAQVQANYLSNPTPEVSQLPVQGGLLFAGVNGQSSAEWPGDHTRFMPRFGLAYTLNSKTVFRGGYGIFTGVGGISFATSNQEGFSLQNFMVPTLDNGLSFIANLANPFPSGITMTPPGAALGAMTYAGKSVSFFNQSIVPPYIQRWQMGVQRELPGRVLLDVSYAGNHGLKLYTTRNLDALPDRYLSTSPVRDQTTINYLTANLPNPFYPLLPGTSLSGTTVARSQLLLPYPQFTGVSMSTNQGYDWYDALQVRIERRMSNGLTVHANYTWSKWMAATTYLNAGDASPVYQPSSLDFPHSGTVSAIYEIPLGDGRKFLAHSSRLINFIFGRWQLEGLFHYQSGQALGFGNALLTGSPIVLPSAQRSINQWFNTKAFVTASASQLANNLVTLHSLFSNIRSDCLKQADLSAMKKFTLHERFYFELRAEFLNAFNNVFLGAPNTSPTSSAFGTVTSDNGAPRNANLGLRVRW